MRVAVDLFSGAGGAFRSLAALDDVDRVVGVDHDPNPRHPGECVEHDLTDGLPQRVLDLVGDPDVEVVLTWASPPCQGITTLPGCDAPQLIPLARELAESIGAPFAIENLDGARNVLDDPVLLSGECEPFAADPRPLDVLKRRAIETSFPCRQPAVDAEAAFGFAIGSRESPAPGFREAHGFDRLAHMYQDDVRQAIPPHYVAWVVSELRGESYDAVRREQIGAEGLA